ncbi:unnamed protein product [Orchesella dallaii]|uniref:Uncharacterized protein n=1 Tax=Orchesella dallaii TaxID=48710 RepID=A0ABP1S1C6_9HEXA
MFIYKKGNFVEIHILQKGMLVEIHILQKGMFVEIHILQKGMLELWCNENGMKINTEKTKCMYFYKSNDKASKDKCTINPWKPKVYGNEIEVVNSFRYLGIILSSDLKYKSHYKHVENKMNAALGRLHSLRRSFTDNVLKTFLSAFVISILDYGIVAWCVQSESEIDKLQNKISRFIFSFCYSSRNMKKKLSLYKSTDVSSLYKKFELLTIFERKHYMSLKFVYRYRLSIFKP